MDAFAGQMTKLTEKMESVAHKRSRPKAKRTHVDSVGLPAGVTTTQEPEGVNSNDLDDLPDLDPSSWEAYQQFIRGDEEVDALLAQVLKATESNYEKASGIQEESQKQDILSQKLQNSVGEALDTSSAANELADTTLAEMDETVSRLGLGSGIRVGLGLGCLVR